MGGVGTALNVDHQLITSLDLICTSQVYDLSVLKFRAGLSVLLLSIC